MGAPVPTPRDLPTGRAFVDAKVPTDALDRLQQLEAAGFAVVDTSVHLTRAAGPLDLETGQARFATPADEAAVRAVAAEAITQSRFHLDPAIPKATAHRLKADWAGNFFAGRRGDWMVVAEEAGEVCGFLQLLRSEDGVVIDLIGVSGRRRSRGLGGQMVAFAARHCLGRPARLTVGTQIANVRSLAFYQRLGFTITSALYVLHLHSSTTA
jgi:ribosomal protein S18 acetylase RimI-like enzyme